MVYSDGISNHGFEMERLIGPNVIQVLHNFAFAWNIKSTIYRLQSDRNFTYAWYLQDGGVSLVLGWIDNPNNVFALRDSPKLLVGKLNKGNPLPSSVTFRPVSNFITLASFSLNSPDVFNEACEWIDNNWQKFTAY